MRNIGPSLALLALLTTGHVLGQLSTTIQLNKPEKPVVGTAFSADRSVRIVQHLANGMPLTHEIKGHIYRSADGLERYDGTIPSTDPAHPDPTTMIYILDRVKRTGVLLNSRLKTATVETLPTTATVSVSFLALQQPRVQNQLIRPENLVTTDLGKRTLDMMPLVGKRVTGTIPAGKIGNDQPLPVTTDVWFAPQLKLLVNEVEKNPLSGERTFELTNIRAEEPDPTLFDIPEGYTVKDRPAVPSTMPSMLKESAAPPSGPFVPEQRTKQIGGMPSTIQVPSRQEQRRLRSPLQRDHLSMRNSSPNRRSNCRSSKSQMPYPEATLPSLSIRWCSSAVFGTLPATSIIVRTSLRRPRHTCAQHGN